MLACIEHAVSSILKLNRPNNCTRQTMGLDPCWGSHSVLPAPYPRSRAYDVCSTYVHVQSKYTNEVASSIARETLAHVMSMSVQPVVSCSA